MASDIIIDKEVGESHQQSEKDVESQRSNSESLRIPTRSKEADDSDSTATETDAQAAIHSGILDWDSPDDVGNPRNWSFAKRVFHTAVPAFYGFLV
jgi:hypothetical protein